MADESQIARVENIAIGEIAPNPHNPRRLFDEEPMQVLQESIAKLGVLVPITVYQRELYGPERPRLTRYVLLDGERRLRCVIALQRDTIPGIIVDQPTDVNNILTMFHIHNLREGWQLMPTALKLQKLMEELDTSNERELNTLTKLSISQIRRCKILLSYDEKYWNMMLAPQSERLKADFFIELDRIRKPALTEGFPPWASRGDEQCIDILLRKYHHDVIKAVTEFRELAAKYRGAVYYDKLDAFFEQLDRFFDDEHMGIDDIRVADVEYHKAAFEARRSSSRLLNQLRDLDDEALAADEELVKTLLDLAREIRRRLTETLVVEAHDELS